MRKLILTFITLALLGSVSTAVEVAPKFWIEHKKVVAEMKSVFVLLADYDATGRKAEKGGVGTSSIALCQVLDGLCDLKPPESDELVGEINKVVKCNIMLATLDKKLSLHFATILARASITTEEKSFLMTKFFELRESLFKQTEASNVYISKLAQLIK